jgi:hypothetical protein
MPKEKYHLEILLHLENGRTARFSQSDPALATELMTSIDPSSIFKKRTLLLCGEESFSVFPTDQIVRVETNHIPPEWIDDSTEIRADQIADYDYRWLCDTLSAVHETVSKADWLSTLIVAAEVELSNAERFYLRIEAPCSKDQDSALQELVSRVLESGGLLTRMRTGGYSVINPARFVRFTLCPALARCASPSVRSA